MTTVNQYRLYCVTESAYVTKWDTETPSVCPNNNAHTIDNNSITIINSVSTENVLIEENTNGDFETKHVTMEIPTGTPGDVTEHDVTWDMDILLWLSYLKPTSDMINDELSVVAIPETTIGVITSTVNIGDTVLNVNSDIFANVRRGYLITLDDNVNKDVLGRCTAVDPLNNTITVKTATSYSYAPGTHVKISIYIIEYLYISDTDLIPIGAKGMKGKIVPAGKIIRVYYTNNSGTAKTFRWRPEYYNNG